MLKKKFVIEAIGFAAVLAGYGLNFVSSWADNKKLDRKIAEEVAKAVAKQK